MDNTPCQVRISGDNRTFFNPPESLLCLNHSIVIVEDLYPSPLGNKQNIPMCRECFTIFLSSYDSREYCFLIGIA